MFVQCHIEETDQFGNPIITSSNSNNNVTVEVDTGEDEEEDTEQEEEEEEEDAEEENKSKVTRAIPSNIPPPPRPFPTSANDVQGYLEEAEHRYIKWQRALTSFKKETNIQEKVKKKALVESLEDMAILSMQQYLSANI